MPTANIYRGVSGSISAVDNNCAVLTMSNGFGSVAFLKERFDILGKALICFLCRQLGEKIDSIARICVFNVKLEPVVEGRIA